MTRRYDPRYLIWLLIALALLGIAVALSETCWWMQISGQETHVLQALGCDL